VAAPATKASQRVLLRTDRSYDRLPRRYHHDARAIHSGRSMLVPSGNPLRYFPNKTNGVARWAVTIASSSPSKSARPTA
jgi:hypothetical protein